MADDRGRRRRALASARGRRVGRKFVAWATIGDCSRLCSWTNAGGVTAPEFAHGVYLPKGVERDVDEGRLLKQSWRARSGWKEGGGGSGGSSRTPLSWVEKGGKVVAIIGRAQ